MCRPAAAIVRLQSQATPMEDSSRDMTENVERTEVIDLMSETREITEVINEIQGGTKQIHGAVGRDLEEQACIKRCQRNDRTLKIIQNHG